MKIQIKQLTIVASSFLSWLYYVIFSVTPALFLMVILFCFLVVLIMMLVALTAACKPVLRCTATPGTWAGWRICLT